MRLVIGILLFDDADELDFVSPWGDRDYGRVWQRCLEDVDRGGLALEWFLGAGVHEEERDSSGRCHFAISAATIGTTATRRRRSQPPRG